MTDQPAQFDAYAESYDDTVNRSIAFVGLRVDYFTRVKADYLLDILSRHLGDSRAIDLLDVGCGVANSHPLITKRLGSVSGTDVSAECLAEAARRNPAGDYRAYAGARLPYEDGQFGAAVATCVLHHVPPEQWRGFLAEMKRVVRPGGVTVIFEHNPLNPLARRAVSNCAFDADAVLLSRRRTRALMDEAGFRVAEARSILSIPVLGPRTRRIDRELGRLPLGAQYYVAGIA
ncbi:MAG: class I SAM-dependent methyltransferase [Novosphingobium sp.]